MARRVVIGCVVQAKILPYETGMRSLYREGVMRNDDTENAPGVTDVFELLKIGERTDYQQYFGSVPLPCPNVIVQPVYISRASSSTELRDSD